MQSIGKENRYLQSTSRAGVSVVLAHLWGQRLHHHPDRSMLALLTVNKAMQHPFSGRRHVGPYSAASRRTGGC
jgi:hypothetical protein